MAAISGNGFILGTEGDDQITGGAGNDTIRALGGDNTVDGGTGFDIAEFDVAGGSQNRVTASLMPGSGPATNGFGGRDTLIGIEGLRSLYYDDVLQGDDGPNRLEGTIGNDTLLGMGGDDTIPAEAGNDLLDGGEGRDRVVFQGERAGYRVEPTVVDGQAGFVVTDTRAPNFGGDGRDTVLGAEDLQFADRTYPAVEVANQPSHDTYVWALRPVPGGGFSATGDWNDPANWSIPNVGPAARPPGPEDWVYFPSYLTGKVVSGGGAAERVVIGGDAAPVFLTGTGSERYSFGELEVGFAGGNLFLRNAVLDAGVTKVPEGGLVDVSQAAIAYDSAGRPYGASLGAVFLEATPGSSPFPGRLNLGDRNLEVIAFSNGASGIGNDFDPLRGVTGTGQLLYPEWVSPAEPYVTTPFSSAFPPPGFSLSLPPRLEALDFGTIPVGESRTLTFSVVNATAGYALPLLGAVQTAANGGRVTDPALSGGGVTPGNFSVPGADFRTQDFSVTLTGTTAHRLEGQAVHLAFFDGSALTGVTLPITGTVVAATPAPTSIPTLGPVDWDAPAAQPQAGFAVTEAWLL
jgi:hypothetical protein